MTKFVSDIKVLFVLYTVIQKNILSTDVLASIILTFGILQL